MARNFMGSRKITTEDKYTKGKIQFSKGDEYFEYFCDLNINSREQVKIITKLLLSTQAKH